MEIPMKTERQPPTQDALEQAAEWYWQIREADVPVEAIGQWQAWLHASPGNRAAFAEIEETLRQVDGVQDPPWPSEAELTADTYDGSMTVAEWRAGERSRRRPALRSREWTWGIAASILVTVATAAMLGQLAPWGNAPTPPDSAIYETQAAEHRDVHLPDGSTVTLGGKSVISTAYTSDRRLVVLKAGAAFFDVAKDATRPFIVEAGGRRIVAVGTAFNVTRQVDRVVVTVTEGVVTVSPDADEHATAIGKQAAGAGDPAVARLEAGHQLAYDEQAVTLVTVADPADALAWREGRLKYRGESLRYVVDDVNRYAERPIVLADAAAGDISFTGTVFEQRINAWVQGLEQAFPLQVEETGSTVIIRHKVTGKPDRQ